MKILNAQLQRINVRSGDTLTVHYTDGLSEVGLFKEIDQSHFRLGGAIYNTMEFAQALQNLGATITVDTHHD